MKRKRVYLSAYKKLLVLFMVIVFTICGVILFWSLTIKLPYEKYEKLIMASLEIESEFDYSIRTPDFLSSNGKIIIEKVERDLEIELTIEHNILGKQQYYLYLKDKDYAETIRIDGMLNYIPQDHDNIELKKTKEKLLLKYQNETRRIMQEANNILEG